MHKVNVHHGTTRGTPMHTLMSTKTNATNVDVTGGTVYLSTGARQRNNRADVPQTPMPVSDNGSSLQDFGPGGFLFIR